MRSSYHPTSRQVRRQPGRGSFAAPRFPFPYPYSARRTAGFNSWLPGQFFWLAAALLSAAVLAALLLVGIYGLYMLSGRILPGVFIGQYPAGSQSQAGLIQNLENEWNQKQIILTDGMHAWPVVSSDIGLRVNAVETTRRAFLVGRGQHILPQMLWLARFGKLQVEPVITFDAVSGRAGLEAIAAQLNQPAQNAALRLQNGQWIAVPGESGSSLNIDETLRLIAAQPASALTTGLQPVVMVSVSPQISDLTPVLSRLKEALRHPLVVEAYDPITDETLRITVPEERIAGWLKVEPRGDDIEIGLDGSQLAAYLEEWGTTSLSGADRRLAPFEPPADLSARWQNQQPVTVMIEHRPTNYTVEQGDTLTRIAFKVGMPYWKIQQANPGIDSNQLIPGQNLVIPSKNEMLPLPVVRGKRVVISISQQYMWTYENGALRTEHVISTGIDRSPTIPGIYQIQTHDPLAYASVWDLTMPHFMGIYEGWPGFMNGIHGLPTLSNGRRLWSGSLGRPVSYGCIILGLEEAEDLYQWAEAGVIVEIQP
jgi:LysM repeat protein